MVRNWSKWYIFGENKWKFGEKVGKQAGNDIENLYRNRLRTLGIIRLAAAR